MEEDEEEVEEEGYAIGENWEWDGGLRDREASRSFGGCLGRREATDIVRGRGKDGREQGERYGRFILISTEPCTCFSASWSNSRQT